MNEKDIGVEFVNLIRQLVREEMNQTLKNKIECVTKARVLKVNENNTYDVFVITDNVTVQELKSTVGELSVGDNVNVYYTGNSYNNGYIGFQY